MIDLAASWRAAFAPPDRRPIWEWAKDNITLPEVLSRTGKFDPSVSPHFLGPLAAIHSDTVREVSVLAPPRSGKTLIADLAVPWAIACDHASVLWIFHVDPLAKSHAELRLWPVIEKCPPLASLLPSDRHKKRTQEIVFTNGLPLIVSGSALSNLQSRGFKWVIEDEPWLYEPGRMSQAEARVGDFRKLDCSKIIRISQGGKEESDWDTKYKSGVIHDLSVPCMGCNQRFFPRWSERREDRSRCAIVFDEVKRPDGSYDEERAFASVRYICPHCGHEHANNERTRLHWKRGSHYCVESLGPNSPAVTTFPRRASFHWNDIIDVDWRDLISEWFQAQRAKRAGNYAPLLDFIQKRLAEMRSEASVGQGDNAFAKFELPSATIDPAAKLWPDEVARILTIDRQSQDTYWLTIRAWAKGGRSRRVHFGRAYGEPELEEIRRKFAIAPNCVVIDSGYRPKGDHGVYAACIRYGWIAAKGDEKHEFFHSRTLPDGQTQRVRKPWAPVTYHDPGEGTTEQGKRRCPLVVFSAPTMAARVKTLIDAGLWEEPAVEDVAMDEIEREYRTQMSAEFEKPRINKITGRRELVWVCPSGNNHAFDCSKMQVLAAMQMGLIPAGVEIAGRSSEAETRALTDTEQQA